MVLKLKTNKTTERTTPRGRRVISEMKKLQAGPFVKIGIQSEDFSQAREDADEAGTTNGTVGLSMEFGLPNQGVPARPWLRSAAKKNRAKWAAVARKGMARVMQGKMTVAQVLDTVGVVATADVKQRIVDIRTPPNTPATIARKGSSNPLVAKGNLGQSISHVVVKGGDTGGKG